MYQLNLARTFALLLFCLALPAFSHANILIFSEDFESGWADGDPWFNSTTPVNGWTGESRDDAVTVQSAPSPANAPNLGNFFTDFNDHDDPNAVVTIGNPANLSSRTETTFILEWDMSALSYGGTDGSIHYYGFSDNLTNNNINGNMFGNITSAMDADSWNFGFSANGPEEFALGEWARVRLTVDISGAGSVMGEYNRYDSGGNLTGWNLLSGSAVNGPTTTNLPLTGIAFGHRDIGLTTAAVTQSEIGIDNIEVYAVSLIPEPSTLTLLLPLLALAPAFQRRRR